MNSIIKWLSYLALILFCMGGGGLLVAFGGRWSRTLLNFEIDFAIGAVMGLVAGIALVAGEIKDRKGDE